jgi:adenylate cyclase
MQESPYTILIVEDEEPLSQVLVERFQNEGFNIISAKDGEEALATALEKKPDLIILDIVMPKMSGLSMLKELRTNEAGKDLPVIILTNLSDTETVNQALTGGATEILVKSDWDISSIVQNVREKLENKK